MLAKRETSLRNRKCPTRRICFNFLSETSEQFVPSQTKRQCNENAEAFRHLNMWYPQVCPKGSCIHSAQFHLYPLHPERVPEAGKPDLVWSSRISYSSGHFQIICPYPPDKKCLGRFRASWKKFSCQLQLRVTTVWLRLLWGLRLMFHEVFIGKNENNLFQLLCRSQIYIIIGCNAIHDGLPQRVWDTIPASVSALEEQSDLLHTESMVFQSTCIGWAVGQG